MFSLRAVMVAKPCESTRFLQFSHAGERGDKPVVQASTEH